MGGTDGMEMGVALAGEFLFRVVAGIEARLHRLAQTAARQVFQVEKATPPMSATVKRRREAGAGTSGRKRVP
jgi:hypothetical protein